MTNTSEKLIQVINGLPGRRIVSVFSFNSVNPDLDIDVTGDGVWGDHDGDFSIFRDTLPAALAEGSLIIMRFLEDTVVMNGTALPRSICYGAFFEDNEVYPVPCEFLKEMFRTVAQTDRKMDGELAVEYGEFADLWCDDSQNAAELRKKCQKWMADRASADKRAAEPLSYEKACEAYHAWAQAEALEEGYAFAITPQPNAGLSVDIDGVWYLENVNGRLAKVSPKGRVTSWDDEK